MIGPYYLHPATARSLLAYSRALRQFTRMGWPRAAANELAQIHLSLPQPAQRSN